MSLSGHKRDVVSVRYCKLTKILYSVSQNIIKVEISLVVGCKRFKDCRKVFIGCRRVSQLNAILSYDAEHQLSVKFSQLLLIHNFIYSVMGFAARVR